MSDSIIVTVLAIGVVSLAIGLFADLVFFTFMTLAFVGVALIISTVNLIFDQIKLRKKLREHE